MLAKARLKFKFGLTLTKVYPEEDEFVFISKAQVNCFLSHPITALETREKKPKVYSSTEEVKRFAKIYNQTVPLTCNEM